MAILTTLGALVGAEPALARLAAVPLSVKAAYHVAKLARLVGVETAHYHEQHRKALEDCGAERDATPAEAVQFGGPRVLSVTPDRAADFTARVAELQALAVELAWRPLELELLGAITITPADVRALGPLLAEPTEAA